MGRAMAQTFAADGDHVVLLGRRPQVLEQTALDLRAQLPERRHRLAAVRRQFC